MMPWAKVVILYHKTSPRCRFSLRLLEHMKPWAQVVKLMTSTVNPSTVNPKESVLENEPRIEQEPRK